MRLAESMADTYYTPEQEARLARLIDTTMRTTLAPRQWNTTPFVRDFASFSRDSPLWSRFSTDTGFLDIPAAALMLGEVLFLAEENGWRVERTAALDTAYASFIEQGHTTLMEKHRRQTAGFEKILREITPLGRQSWYAPYGTGHTFVPAFRLARGDECAYASWCNESYTLPSDKTRGSLWENVVLDREDQEPLEINPVLFYNPSMELDIRERQRVRRFWE